VSPEDARHQKPTQLGLPLDTRSEAPRGQRSGEASTLANGEERSGSDQLMEQVVARGNVRAALARVRENRGSPGVDGMTVEELPQYRRADGKTGKANQRHAALAAYPSLAQRRPDGRRSSGGAPGGDAAGRTTYPLNAKGNFAFERTLRYR